MVFIWWYLLESSLVFEKGLVQHHKPIYNGKRFSHVTQFENHHQWNVCLCNDNIVSMKSWLIIKMFGWLVETNYLSNLYISILAPKSYHDCDSVNKPLLERGDFYNQNKNHTASLTVCRQIQNNIILIIYRSLIAAPNCTSFIVFCPASSEYILRKNFWEHDFGVQEKGVNKG